ncbi:unnamed protein product, partial [marine sediment metagenome]
LEEESPKVLSAADRRRLEQSRLKLNYFLGNILLEMVEKRHANKRQFLDEAKESLKRIEQAMSPNAYVAKFAGRVALAEGRTTEAAQLLEQADKGFRGRDPQTALLLISLYSATAPEKAEKILDRFLRKAQFARNPALLQAKARLKMQQRQYDEASQLIRRILQINPNDTEARALKVELELLAGPKKE